jgi:hypothetical protein
MEFDGEDGVVRAQAFFKKTRKGKVIRIVEQRYMRDDASCGYLCGKELSRVSAAMTVIASNASMR